MPPDKILKSTYIKSAQADSKFEIGSIELMET